MKNLLKIMLSFLFYSIVSMLSSSAYATLVISDNSLSLQLDRCSSPEVRDMVSESILNSGDVSVSETTENTALFKFRYPRNAIHENLAAQFILYNSKQSEVTRSATKTLKGSTAGFISEPVGNIDEDKYYVFIAVVLNTDKKKYCTLESETVTITNELTNSSPSLIRSDVTPSNIRVNESVTFQSIWQDPDSSYITDVTARYRLIGTSSWSQQILDAISGDVRTGYTFNLAVVMTQVGNYEVEFRASDSNGNTTAFQGRRTFTVTEDNNAAPTLNSSQVTPESLALNESVIFQSIWQDPDSNYITDVTVRYRLIGTSSWSQEVLDAISGDVRTGYTFNLAVVMTQVGNYEVEFRASDSNGNTTAFQGRRTFTVTEYNNAAPTLNSSQVTPESLALNESVMFQSIWQDPDSNYITDVTVRYRLIGASSWSQEVLDAISGDVRTGYTFNLAVVMTQVGNYEAEFRASDSNDNTTAFQGRRTFTVTEDNNAAPTLNSSQVTPESLALNESVMFQSIWQDPDSNYITDVTVRYRLIGASSWSQEVLDAISGDVRTGYTFNLAVVMTQVGNYEVEFRASDSNGNTTAFQGRRTFTVTETNPYKLLVTSQNGSVQGEGINCPSDCTESYTQETVSNSLTATPNTGYKFSQWSTSGQCSYQGDLLQSSINITLSGDCTVTASFTTISDSAPILTITQNLESCLTRTDKKCVVLGQTATLKFDIFDNNNNLSMLDVNWDGIDSPEKSHNISGGNTSVESSYIFTNADIADCPNNEYYRNDEVCWKKDITVTATAYDASNNPSNVFSQEFILYDNDGYNLAKEALENANKELEDKENLLEQQTSQEISYASEIASLSNSCQLNKKFNWEDKNSLLEYDPFRVIDGKPEYCRKDRATLISCASIDSQCSALAGLGAGINYEIKTTYDYESYVVSADCKNYPARVESSYTIDGVKTEYETKFVNNHTQKIDYLTSVSNRLKDELITQGSDRYVGKCNLDDYKEWGLSDWQKAIESHPDFEETIQTILRKTDFSLNQVVKIRIEFKKGQAKALMDFVSAYAELPSDVAAVIGSSLKFVRDSWNDPSGTTDRLVENTGELNEFASQLYQEFTDAVPLIPAAISHWSLEDLAYTNGYAQTRISLEIGVTLVSGGSAQGVKWAVKYGKATKYSDIKWMTSLINAVNSYKYGVKASKKVLNSLSPDSSNKFRETFRLGTDKDKQEAANLFHKDVGNKELVDEIENNVGKRAQALGKAGEKIVAENYNIGSRIDFVIEGRKRISDGYIEEVSLTEIKNVKKQGLTLQIKDNIKFAADEDIDFNLYIRSTADITKPLKLAAESGQVNIIYVDMPH